MGLDWFCIVGFVEVGFLRLWSVMVRLYDSIEIITLRSLGCYIYTRLTKA
jgi:hypothetical protein